MTKTKKLWIIWAVLYGLCTLLSFFPIPSGAGSGALILLSVGFFVPGGLLIEEGKKRRDAGLLKKVRLVCLLSLSLTLLGILLNFFSVNGSQAWGTVAYWFLILVSTPMVCAQVWLISMFLWACLLMGSIFGLKKK